MILSNKLARFARRNQTRMNYGGIVGFGRKVRFYCNHFCSLL